MRSDSIQLELVALDTLELASIKPPDLHPYELNERLTVLISFHCVYEEHTQFRHEVLERVRGDRWK